MSDIPPEPISEFHELERPFEGGTKPDLKSRDIVIFSGVMILAFFHLFEFGTIAAIYSLRQMSAESPRLKYFGYFFAIASYFLVLASIFIILDSVFVIVVMVVLNAIVFFAYLLL